MSTIKGIKVGETTLKSTYVDGNSRQDSKSIEVTAVTLGTISAPQDTTYTGYAITPTPTVTVTFNGVETTLELGTDYTLSYSNNTNVRPCL